VIASHCCASRPITVRCHDDDHDRADLSKRNSPPRHVLRNKRHLTMGKRLPGAVAEANRRTRCLSQTSSTHVCPELGTTLHDVIGVGNKYPWANSSSGAVVGRRDRRLHSLCSAETQAAKNCVSPDSFHRFSFCFLLWPARPLIGTINRRRGQRRCHWPFRKLLEGFGAYG
jgi:hypothetical protein